MAEKFSVSGIMYLLSNMYIYVKISMSPNTLGVKFPFFSLSWIIFLCLNTEMRSFAYYWIRRGDCEVTLCSYPLGEASVSESRLILVVFFTLSEWITWWI